MKGKGSDLSNILLEPINIPIETVEAKLGLKSFATYNNIPNVEKGRNNQLKTRSREIRHIQSRHRCIRADYNFTTNT